MNRLIKEYFSRWPLLGMGSLILLVCLLGACAFGVSKAFSAPTETSKQVTVLSYSLRGDFGFDAQLTDNALYGPIILTEEDASLLFLTIVESIEGNFYYQVTSSQPLEQVRHDVEITATLENPENWSKPIVLIPETRWTGDFTLVFPIDTAQLLKLADEINLDIEVSAHIYSLTIRASVHTVAQTDYGTINDVVTQSLTGTLQSKRLTWTGGWHHTETRSFKDIITVPLDRGAGRTGWPVGLAFVVLFGSYIAWNFTHVKLIPISPAEKEANWARRKYKDVIVDVSELPKVSIMQTVVEVNCLDDLAKTADQLLRPVLHKVEPGKHTYCVIDGPTRYEYVSYEYVSLEPSAPEEEEED